MPTKTDHDILTTISTDITYIKADIAEIKNDLCTKATNEVVMGNVERLRNVEIWKSEVETSNRINSAVKKVHLAYASLGGGFVVWLLNLITGIISKKFF